METTQPNEVLNESAKLTEKWFKDASEAITDIYNKQLNLTLSLYNSWANAWLGAGNNRMRQPGFNSFFSEPGFGRWNFFAGFNPMGTYFAWLDKTWKQALNYNQEGISFLNDAAKSNTVNWEGFAKQYSTMFGNRFETMSDVINAASESYKKLLGTSFDDYKKIVEQSNKQLAELVKQNEAFWSEATTVFNHDTKQDKNKNLIPVDTRKKSNNVAV